MNWYLYRTSRTTVSTPAGFSVSFTNVQNRPTSFGAGTEMQIAFVFQPPAGSGATPGMS